MKTLAVLSSLGSIAAGLYLLQTQAIGESSWFEALAHGIGIYFIAKGLYLGPSLWAQHESHRHLEYLAGVAETTEQRRALHLEETIEDGSP